MINIAAAVDRAIKATGVAIDGISIGKYDDKRTWTVHPSDLQAAAQPTIDAFDPTDPALVTAERDADFDSLKAIRALAEATYELKTNVWTKAQFLARVKQVYRTL